MCKTGSKRFLSILISLTLIISTVAFFSSQSINTDAVKSDSKKVLLKRIEKKSRLKVVKSCYADYNGNGTKELFAICREEGTNIWAEKEIWFASKKQTKRLYKSTMYISSAVRAKVSSKKKLFIAELSGGGSGSSSIWYYVKSDKAKGNSRVFSGLEHIKRKSFKITEHAFDNYTGDSAGGHTYKQYYIKWNGKGFTEYKGKVISKSKLKGYTNGSSVLKKIKALDYSVGKIFKRGNGIININIYKSDGYGSTRNENVNLKLKNNKVSLIVIYKNGSNIVEKSSYGGIYKSGIL